MAKPATVSPKAHAGSRSVSAAKFELGESEEPEQREATELRQRPASDVIDRPLACIG